MCRNSMTCFSTNAIRESLCWSDAWYSRWESSSQLQRSKMEKVSLTSGRRRLCGMRLQWDDDNATLPPPTHPTKHNVHLDIFSNIRFSPKLCRWGFNRKTWRDSGGLCSKIFCCILRYRTNSLTINEKPCQPGWRPLQASCFWDLRRNAWRPLLRHYNRKTKRYKQLGASASLSMKMEQFLPWTIVRLGVKKHESEVSFTDRAHLKNLGIGKHIPLLHSDFQVGEPMGQGGTASSSAISWGSSLLAIR